MSLDILFVDDQDTESICTLMGLVFDKRHVKIFSVISGDEAIEFVRKNPVDLVVLDYNMPGKGGYQTAKELREIRKDIKIAGYSESWSKKEAEEAGLVLFNESIEPIIEYISKKLIPKH